MPRDLGDVLHCFLPEAGDPPEDAAVPAAPASPTARVVARPRRERPAALPLACLAVGDSDVVRAAFAWNLLVEVARLGGRAVLVAPAGDGEASLWPSSGPGPMGSEVSLVPARGPGELHRAALDRAVTAAAEADPEVGGLVFVRVPPTWLRKPADAGALLRWTLLFSSDDARDLLETYGIAKLLLRQQPSARVGVTIHGVRRIEQARQAFGRLARSSERHLGRRLRSYGLLVDDLHVYRAIVARRPIGLAHPQSPAARALRDVAGMLLDDARELALA